MFGLITEVTERSGIGYYNYEVYNAIHIASRLEAVSGVAMTVVGSAGLGGYLPGLLSHATSAGLTVAGAAILTVTVTRVAIDYIESRNVIGRISRNVLGREPRNILGRILDRATVETLPDGTLKVTNCISKKTD